MNMLWDQLFAVLRVEMNNSNTFLFHSEWPLAFSCYFDFHATICLLCNSRTKILFHEAKYFKGKDIQTPVSQMTSH